MKKVIFFLNVLVLSTGLIANAQMDKGKEDKSKRPSPPAMTKETISSGATLSVDYSQPSVKGRTIGKDVEPMQGKVWRAGANETTVFETSKDIMVEGKSLPAGKYGFFVINNGSDWTLIFDKTWNMWGTDYGGSTDALRINVSPAKAKAFAEKLTYKISKDGKVSLLWGNDDISFNVK